MWLHAILLYGKTDFYIIQYEYDIRFSLNHESEYLIFTSSYVKATAVKPSLKIWRWKFPVETGQFLF